MPVPPSNLSYHSVDHTLNPSDGDGRVCEAGADVPKSDRALSGFASLEKSSCQGRDAARINAHLPSPDTSSASWKLMYLSACAARVTRATDGCGRVYELRTTGCIGVSPMRLLTAGLMRCGIRRASEEPSPLDGLSPTAREGSGEKANASLCAAPRVGPCRLRYRFEWGSLDHGQGRSLHDPPPPELKGPRIQNNQRPVRESHWDVIL
jgi:hypothetical protein